MAGRIENLCPRWKPGQSGNPKGRPRRHRAVIDIIGLANHEKLVLALLDRALAGDMTAAKLILDRTDPVLSRRQVTGLEGEPIRAERADLIGLTNDELRALDALATRIEERRTSNEDAPRNGDPH